MTPRDTSAADAAGALQADAQVRISIDVPPDIVMGLLGSADENLRALERSVIADLHVRGNAITISGESADVARAERVISELVAIVANGQVLTPEVVRHSVAMLAGTDNESPAEVLTLDILSRRGKTIRPRPSTRSATSTPSTPTPSCSGSARPAPARPTWRWPRRSTRCRPSRSAASS
ncbi:phoH family protein [Mycobacterium avium subsp. avium 2285 (R)]|nr:phoH family protein [Mycobacterium avium subsp. avium 2285 (R)]